MMSDYAFISIIALYCYVFLLIAFLPSKRTRLINNFILVLINMFVWILGSLLMRATVWPSYEFWYHVSVTGIWILPCTYARFIRDYAGVKKSWVDVAAFVFLLGGSAVNAVTNFFLAPPNLVRLGNHIEFVYHMEWPVIVMYGVCALVVIRIIKTIYDVYKIDRSRAIQLMPLLLGIVALFIGNIGISILKSFPLDIVAGIVNAILMIWMLYCGHVFKLTLLVSKGNCYLLALGLSILVFFNLSQSLDRFIRFHIPQFAEYSVMIVTLMTMFLTSMLYWMMKILFDRLVVREEQKQNERLTEYTMLLSKSLEVKEIYRALVSVISETLGVKKVYICICEADGSYKIAYSTSQLDGNRFHMMADHPLIIWLKQSSGCLLYRDFKRTVIYKSLWEAEKKLLDDLRVDCFLPLKDGDEMVGVVLLSEKERKRKQFTIDDVSFLNSLESVSSIALKNSRLYERAYREARTDDLTGILNRKCFYEMLEETYQRCSRTAMSVIIINVDDFKLYNQLYGAQEGDLALKHIAQIIAGTVGENGFVARYSGKEFAVILPEFDVYSAKNMAANICDQIHDMNKSNPEACLKALTVSCGVSAIPYGATTTLELIQNADQAVYHVKRAGKNGIMVYTDSLTGTVKGSSAEDRHKSMYSEYAQTIYALTAAIDAKDHYTFQHSNNVAYYAEALARELKLPEEHREIIREAALLHDVGKIGVPEQILNKEMRLTDEEYELMKGHVEGSVSIIRHLPSMEYVIPAVIGHHERFDGKGYPRRIAGNDIPLAARILCVADSFDAMVSRRCYKPAMSIGYALEELDRGAGTQFDPMIANTFISMIRENKITPVLSKSERMKPDLGV